MDRAYRNLAGYGPLEPLEPLLADGDVWEIMVNGPDAIFANHEYGGASETSVVNTSTEAYAL